MDRLAVGLVVLTSLAVMPAIADDYTLGIFGNANMDDTIDEDDIEYVEGIVGKTNEETKYADANYDGKIDEEDITQIELIIDGKEKELTFVDSADRIVTINMPVERVVSINPRIIETMRSIDAVDKVVGVPNSIIKDNEFFPEFSEYPNVGETSTPNLELILKLRPDVVVAYATWRVSQSEEIQNRLMSADSTITLICIDGFKPENYVEEVEKLGYILGKKEEAKDFIDFYQQYMNTIKASVDELSEDDKPTVYFETESYKAVGTGTGWHQDVVTAGGKNIFDDVSGYPTVDPEEVIKRDPEIIVRTERGGDALHGGYLLGIEDTADMVEWRNDVRNRPELQTVNAVATEQVYVISDYIMGGVRHFVGVGYLAKWFHPELFGDLNPQAVHQEYLTRFQGLDYDLDDHGVFVYPPVEGF